VTGPEATELDAARLASVISPLRRTLLAAARATEHLPEIPDAQIVSNLLTTMEANGLVERRPRPGNHRHIEVLATPKAHDLFDRFDLASGDLVARAAATLPAADRAALAAAVPALERLRDALAHAKDAP
jgi:hypothetical protein